MTKRTLSRLAGCAYGNVGHRGVLDILHPGSLHCERSNDENSWVRQGIVGKRVPSGLDPLVRMQFAWITTTDLEDSRPVGGVKQIVRRVGISICDGWMSRKRVSEGQPVSVRQGGDKGRFDKGSGYLKLKQRDEMISVDHRSSIMYSAYSS